MTQTITDRVIAVEQDEKDEVELRLADWTPHGAYTALVDAADKAGFDLTEYSEGDTVGLAEVEYETDTGDEYGRSTDIVSVEFIEPGDEFYADVTVCIEGQIRLPVVEGFEHTKPGTDDWTDEVKEIFSEGVAGQYLELHDPNVTIHNVFRE